MKTLVVLLAGLMLSVSAGAAELKFLVVWTSAAVYRYSQGDPNPIYQDVVAPSGVLLSRISTTFQNAAAPQVITLAGVMVTSNNYQHDNAADLAAIRADQMILSARDAVGADVVIVMTGTGAAGDYLSRSQCENSGYGHGVTPRYPITPAQAFLTAHFSCMVSYHQQAHELGHLLGFTHPFGVEADGGAFQNSHGFVSIVYIPGSAPPTYYPTSLFVDVMQEASDQYANSGYISRNAYSNPNITFQGFPTGSTVWPNYSDHKSILDITVPVLANFHNTKLGRGYGALLAPLLMSLLLD